MNKTFCRTNQPTTFNFPIILRYLVLSHPCGSLILCQSGRSADSIIIFRSSSGECSVTAFKNASARFGSYDKNARCAQSKIHNYGISHLFSKTLRYVTSEYMSLRCANFADMFLRYADHLLIIIRRVLSHGFQKRISKIWIL